MVISALERYERRRFRLKNKVKSSSERPRLCICKSNRHLYAQIIDDNSNPKGSVSLVFVSTSNKENRASNKNFKNVANAKKLGLMIAEKAKAKGIKKVVFDRSGYIYHGIIKAFAEAAREGGLDF